jgi:hypothetical protein
VRDHRDAEVGTGIRRISEEGKRKCPGKEAIGSDFRKLLAVCDARFIGITAAPK